MTTLLKISMIEATRLTREGRLKEALAVLTGALPTALSSATPSPVVQQPVQQGSARAMPPALDMMPPSPGTRDAWTSDPLNEAATKALGHLGTPQIPEALREFLSRLGSMKSAHGLHGRVVPAVGRSPAVPTGARFDECIYTNEAGSRAYKLYVPSRFKGQALPLVVMLHGCTQSPDDFACGTRMNDLAEEQVFLVAYPAQAPSANPSKCWNWFCTSDQQRDQGEPSLIAGITRQIMREFPVRLDRMYIAGLSAGGAAAAVMGATYPELYAAIGVHSGLACGSASDMPSAFTAMRQGGPPSVNRQARDGRARTTVRTIVFHGDCDATVNPVNGNQVIASNARLDCRTTIHHGTDGGMNYTRAVQADESGRPMLEQWVLHGAGHAWSGGSADGSYAEPRGPNASREMIRFFFEDGV